MPREKRKEGRVEPGPADAYGIKIHIIAAAVAHIPQVYPGKYPPERIKSDKDKNNYFFRIKVITSIKHNE